MRAKVHRSRRRKAKRERPKGKELIPTVYFPDSLVPLRHNSIFALKDEKKEQPPPPRSGQMQLQTRSNGARTVQVRDEISYGASSCRSREQRR